MNTVAQVLSPEFPRSWHEAVAIVQEAATHLHSGLALPSPEDLAIEETGALVFGFASESGENPVTGLGGLLQGLLDGVDAPAALRDLATENAKPSPAHNSVESFSRALAFFERPNRTSDLAAIAGRLSTFRDRVNPEQEFERLREKVAGKDATEQKKPQPQKQKLSKRQQRAAAVAVAIGLPGMMALSFGVPGGAHIRDLAARAGDGAGSVVSAGLSSLGISDATEAAPAPEPVEAPAAPKNARSSTRSSTAAAKSSTPAAPSARSRNAPASQARTDAPPREAPTPGSVQSTRAGDNNLHTPADVPMELNNSRVASAGIVEVIPSFVYSDDDREVHPPALVRPQLPREPAPGAETGYFHLVIDESGSVQQVKLVSPTRRYQDRMLVAAAKAWKFRPATLNGEPVKYRMAIPIILPPGMP